jgi:hypothetical protein
MPHKRKEDFINDKRRVSYLHAVYSRIYRDQSILIEGEYGVGKTRFLELIKPKKRKIVWVESLNNIHEILASILQQLDYQAPSSWRRTSKHLKMIKALSGFIIIIDEAGDLNPKVWPYFKRIIDADIPIIFAGLPKVRTFLLNEHPDIVSRLKVLRLYPILVEDFIMDYKDFVPEAIEQIYATTAGDMRKFKEVCVDCRDKAKELKVNLIDVELVLSFIEDLLKE